MYYIYVDIYEYLLAKSVLTKPLPTSNISSMPLRASTTDMDTANTGPSQNACKSVLQCVSTCCRVLQSVAECCSVLGCSELQYVAECCRE